MMPPRKRIGWFLVACSLLGTGVIALLHAQMVTPEDAGAWLLAFGEQPATPWLLFLAVAFGGVIVFPVAPAVIFTGAVYGMSGYTIVLAGLLSACAVGYWIGRRLGADWAQRSPKAKVMADRVVRHGALASMVSRWIPGVPFALQNLLLGASRVPFVTFFLASIIGASGVGLVFLATGAAGAEVMVRLQDSLRFGWVGPAAGFAVGGFLLVGGRGKAETPAETTETDEVTRL